jgi:hypothetical protein
MALRTGMTLRGGRYDYRLIEQLRDKTVVNSVFKAEILAGVQSGRPTQQWQSTIHTHIHLSLAKPHPRAVVKTANINNHVQRNCLLKEYNYYKRACIASSKNFRKLYDTINDQTPWTAQKPFCLALE